MTELDDPVRMRHADADLMSLALMDARNRTLAWLALFEPLAAPSEPPIDLSPALWLAGHVGWFQERWTSRNVLRQRGAAADKAHPPLSSIEPGADAWWDPAACPADRRWGLHFPGHETTRHYLVETLEVTLELLAGAGSEDDALHFYRAALFHEDHAIERFAALAQALDVTAAARLAPEPIAPALR
jgi:hypothetical protein